MKRIILAILATTLICSNSFATNGLDKVAHFTLSGVMSAGIYYGLKKALGVKTTEAAWESFAITSLVGATKEFYMDEFPDSKDFTANELGALVGVSIAILSFD